VTPERWRRVESLFQAALDQAEAERPGFVTRACGADEELRREVESLLRAHEDAAADRVRTGSAAQPTLQPGARLGPYEVAGLIAVGGMGEVYRARDARLGREVAVKVLPRAFQDDASRLARFQQEARAAGALNHPHVLAVYDVGHEGPLPYVVCELLEGETLRSRLARAGMEAAQAIELAGQLASGLRAAHDKGIVHRDLKPANLFLSADGRLKILDFGLAKLTAGRRPDEQTAPGVLLGTVGYMAPEQVRGEPADARSDVFSFGAVVYEMLAGRPAFGQASAGEAMSAILHDEPDPRALPADAPPGLHALLRRCLEKDSRARFADGRELAAALDSVLRGRAAQGGPRARKAVAVLPFRSLAADAEAAQLGLGLADAAITELAQLRRLVVRPTAAVLHFQGQPVDPRAAGRELQVDALVDGTLQRAGARIRVTVQLVDAVDGRTLWAAKLEGSSDDLLRVQDDVARRVAEALELELTPADERQLDRHQKERVAGGDAYAFYLRGQSHLVRESLDECIAALDWFEKARSADPRFALAWAALADTYVRIGFEFHPEGDWYARAEQACAQALDLDPELPEARYVRGRLLWSPHLGFDHAGGLRELAAAAARRRSFDEAWVRLGVVLYHVGLFDEANVELERALAVNPGHVIARGHLAACRYHMGDFEGALVRIEPVLEESRSYWHRYLAAHSLARLGRASEAAALADLMHAQEEGVSHGHAVRGLLAAMAGQRAEAERRAALTVEVKRRYGHFHHDQYDLATIHALLGRTDDALRWLTEAARNGYPCAPFFEKDPLLAGLRAHPGFAPLMAELRAECREYARLWAGIGPGGPAAEASAAG
jgi:TolB-like protein/Tfp pilus assembly protein PilF